MPEDELRPGETFGHALERVAEGGLLRALAGKPLQLAISRLVTGAVAVPEAAFQIPAAFFEGISQRIRSDTEARKQLSATVLKDVKRLAGADKSLTNRALQRWTSNLESKQRNTEKVAARTIELMVDQELHETAGAPCEEFMGPFGDIAENASSDEMADLLARILSGEIHQPGTFSRRTLQAVAALDQRSVTALIECLPYLIDDHWFHIPPSQQDVWHRRFSILTIVGVTNEAGIRTLRHDEANRGAVRMGSKGIVYTCKPGLTAWFADGANLTMVGAELITALPRSEEPRIREVALGLKEHKFIEKLEICDVTKAGDVFEADNCIEVS